MLLDFVVNGHVFRSIIRPASKSLEQSFLIQVTTRLPPVSSFDEDQTLATDSEKILNFIKRTSQESLAYAAAITAAQPFRVISIRMMAQFIGRETKYNSVLGSLVDIYNEEGLSGLWSGLLPRIYGEVLRIWCAATISFLINTYVIEDPTVSIAHKLRSFPSYIQQLRYHPWSTEGPGSILNLSSLMFMRLGALQVRSYISSMSSFLASSLTYPFTLVSTVVSVSGAPITAGGSPHVAIYSNWTQCYAHLKKHEQLKRGSSMFWRYEPDVTRLVLVGKQ